MFSAEENIRYAKDMTLRLGKKAQALQKLGNNVRN